MTLNPMNYLKWPIKKLDISCYLFTYKGYRDATVIINLIFLLKVAVPTSFVFIVTCLSNMIITRQVINNMFIFFLHTFLWGKC